MGVGFEEARTWKYEAWWQVRRRALKKLATHANRNGRAPLYVVYRQARKGGNRKLRRRWKALQRISGVSSDIRDLRRRLEALNAIRRKIACA